MSAAETILKRARLAQVMIATAESCTGGLVAGALTDLPGSSDIFERGFVTYSNASKRQMLGVAQATLDAHGAVSEAVAGEMAMGALKNSHADLAISVTGLAGPGGSDHKPEGRVCFGLAQTGKPLRVVTMEFGALGRDQVRQASVGYALDMLIKALS